MILKRVGYSFIVVLRKKFFWESTGCRYRHKKRMPTASFFYC